MKLKREKKAYPIIHWIPTSQRVFCGASLSSNSYKDRTTRQTQKVLVRKMPSPHETL